GLILIYIEKSYWGLLNIARQYSITSGDEKNSLGESSLIILKTRDSRFILGMFFWSVGTLAFAIVLVTSGVVTPIIGWLGIVAGIAVGFYNGIILVKQTEYKVLQAIGALSAISFEIIIGGWLLFH
ncbi:MAG: DUF4386 family protein, partial [Candidatus Hodarchaeales archaeon]